MESEKRDQTPKTECCMIPFVRTLRNGQTTVTVTENRSVVAGAEGQRRDCFQSARAERRVTEVFHTLTTVVVTKCIQLPKLIKLST